MQQFIRIRPQVFYGTPTQFAKMRAELARAAGIPLTRLHITSEDGDDVAIEVPDLDQFDIEEKNIYGEWDELPEEPLLVLLAHSDETGTIPDDAIMPLVRRLTEVKDQVYDFVLEADGENAAVAAYRNIDHVRRMLADAYAKEQEVTFHLQEVPE
jgi:hypothetical protein